MSEIEMLRQEQCSFVVLSNQSRISPELQIESRTGLASIPSEAKEGTEASYWGMRRPLQRRRLCPGDRECASPRT